MNSEDLVPEKILSLEGGYIYRSQPFKIQATGYLVEFKDQIETIGFYHDEEQTFVNYTQTGIDKRHYGLEFATLWQINSELSVNTALSLGENIYTSRPNATITQDNVIPLSMCKRYTQEISMFREHLRLPLPQA